MEKREAGSGGRRGEGGVKWESREKRDGSHVD